MLKQPITRRRISQKGVLLLPSHILSTQRWAFVTPRHSRGIRKPSALNDSVLFSATTNLSTFTVAQPPEFHFLYCFLPALGIHRQAFSPFLSFTIVPDYLEDDTLKGTNHDKNLRIAWKRSSRRMDNGLGVSSQAAALQGELDSGKRSPIGPFYCK
jgi:hypothetical protein